MSNRAIDLLGSQFELTALSGHPAADATVDHVVLHAKLKALRIIDVKIVPDAAITGQVTDNFTWDVRTVTAAGVATSRATRNYASGINEVALVARSLWTPAAPFTLALGESLSIQRTKVGNGIASPRCLASVEYDYCA
jgi:hypothetical protein